MKYCVFVSGVILACCCAQAHVRYDYSMGPIGSEKIFLRGLHSDFYVMPGGRQGGGACRGCRLLTACWKAVLLLRIVYGGCRPLRH